jgi:outer membrane receptor protein involved in Fe transport
MLGEDARIRYVGSTTDFFGGNGAPVDSVGAGHSQDFPYGIYLQQRWTPLAPLHLNVGARFDSDPRGGQRLSPRAAVTVDVWKGATLKGIYSEAFRAPAYYEYYFASPQELANPNLHSETVRGAEASLEQTIGPHRLLVGGFASWWSDMVQLEEVSTANGGVFQYRNDSSLYNYGGNAAALGHFGRLSYGASVTAAYTRRVTSSGTEPLTVAPSVYGNARATYELGGRWPVLAVATSVIGPRLADRALDGNFPTMPAVPTALEVRVTATGDVPNIPGLSYRLSWDYSTATSAPYVAGPIQNEDSTAAGRPSAELVPVNRMTAFATLRYTFPL